MKNKMPAYKTLEKIFKKLNDLEQVQAVLSWDNAVVMPNGGARARSEQLATLKSLQHAILTDQGVSDLIAKAQDEQRNLSGWQKANLREIQRIFKHSSAVPRKLLQELSKAGSHCEMVWRQARKENNFPMLVAPLKRVVELVREIAQIKGEVLGMSAYDSLIDQYDPGLRTENLDVIFADIKNFLPDFVAKVTEKQKQENKIIPINAQISTEKQKLVAGELLKIMKFDTNKGRLDESHHPFCGGYQGDIRITSRYNENDFMSSLMAVMHELGHAMYENGLPENWSGQPVGQARGMSVHESQSLLIEMQVCRSPEFMNFITPKLKEIFGVTGDEWTADNLYNICNKVEPSLIRVDADEVTYPGHIILRYYIEKYLISGDMTVEDLPDAWRQGMEKFVGVVPTDDANGCMQDIHWMDGTFGYFPTYAMGAIYASQIFATAKTALPTLGEDITQGDFTNLISWLNKNLHDKASRFETPDLINSTTGKTIDLDVYKNHLTSRYLG